MSSEKLVPKKPPSWMPSKKRYPRKTALQIDPKREHLKLKNYLLARRLMVERSLNPEVRAELPSLDRFITYLRSLEK